MKLKIKINQERLSKLGKVFLFLIGLGLYIGGLILGGFTIMSLFNWFVSDIFGIRRITIIIAIGIDILITLLTSHIATKDGNSALSIETVTNNIIGTGFFLLFGFIIHLFI